MQVLPDKLDVMEMQCAGAARQAECHGNAMCRSCQRSWMSWKCKVQMLPDKLNAMEMQCASAARQAECHGNAMCRCC